MELCYVYVPGNESGKRIGLVKFNESGYYQSDIDSSKLSEADVIETVNHLNNGLGISPEISTSARDGSMFGWHCPAAQAAVKFFTKA